MADSFTRILPAYDHVSSSCYTRAVSHAMHPSYDKSITDTPMVDIDRHYTHKLDKMKMFSESMYKLGIFAPPNRKAA